MISCLQIVPFRSTRALRTRTLERKFHSVSSSSPAISKRIVSTRGRQGNNRYAVSSGISSSSSSSSIFPSIPFNIITRGILSDAVIQRVESMVQRHHEVVKLLNDPDTAKSREFSSLGKEMSSLAKVVALQESLADLEAELQGVQELLDEAGQDKELQAECYADMERIQAELPLLEKRILDAVLPHDPNDTDSDAILEIRAGTGGDEAALFAGELLNTYQQTAKAMKFKIDILDISTTDLGGVREAALSLSGRPTNAYATIFNSHLETGEDDNQLLEADEVGPYGFFRFESGVHRVQRVPINDNRIQTSACSVAILPSLPEESSAALLPISELKIETMRASGAGGQHVNTTDSAVRITHIPTGLTASIQDERSQHKNKAKAMKLISARVQEQLRREEDKSRGDERSNLMGGGDRSERIRTYNYPQDRVTDHRCKHSTHGIEKLLQGNLDGGLVATFFPILRREYKEELLKQFEKEDQ